MNHKFFDQSNLIFLFLTAAVGVTIGTYLDLPISQTIADPGNIVYLSLAAYAQSAVWLLLSLVGMAAMRLVWDKGTSRYAGIMFFITSTIAGIGASVYDAGQYVSWHIVIRIIISVLLFAVFDYFAYKKVKDMDREELIRLMTFALLYYALTKPLADLIKDFVGRPRYRLLLNDPGVVYQEWYDISKVQAQALIPVYGIDAFRSFPSGHTINAMGAGIISMVLGGKTEPYILYVLAVMMIRILIGAHFVSDVSAGLLVGLIVLFVLYNICFRIGRKKDGR